MRHTNKQCGKMSG